MALVLKAETVLPIPKEKEGFPLPPRPRSECRRIFARQRTVWRPGGYWLGCVFRSPLRKDLSGNINFANMVSISKIAAKHHDLPISNRRRDVGEVMRDLKIWG